MNWPKHKKPKNFPSGAGQGSPSLVYCLQWYLMADVSKESQNLKKLLMTPCWTGDKPDTVSDQFMVELEASSKCFFVSVIVFSIHTENFSFLKNSSTDNDFYLHLELTWKSFPLQKNQNNSSLVKLILWEVEIPNKRFFTHMN